MAADTFDMELKCPTCGRTGTVTYDASYKGVPKAQPIKATGSYRIEADGWPVCECRGPAG